MSAVQHHMSHFDAFCMLYFNFSLNRLLMTYSAHK